MQKQTIAAQAQADARMARASSLIASMPNVSARATDAWISWSLVVVQLFNKRQLARAVPPWSHAPEPRRPAAYSAGRWRRMLLSTMPQTPRGRLSNPTALA